MAKSLPVSFKEKEKDLLDYVKDKDFSYYVKSLIRKDKEKKESIQKPKNDSRRNINFDF